MATPVPPPVTTVNTPLGGGGGTMKQAPTNLPLREVPGSYGLPYLGALKDRWDFFYLQGDEAFFQTRKEKFKSTVVRANMPPAWPWTDPKCVMLLDQKSYSSVFDYKVVDKTDTFAGTFMPSVKYTGGLRMCAYLDPSEERHAALKSFCFEVMKMGASRWIPEFHKHMTAAFATWERKISKQGSADFKAVCADVMFKTLIKSLMNVDLDTVPEAERPSSGELTAWVGLQLLPVVGPGIFPWPIDDLIFHALPFSHVFTQSGYDKMVKFVHKYAAESLDVSQKFNVSREDAAHNLIFFTGLNALGGFAIFLPTIIQLVGASAPLQAELRVEIREAVKANGGLNMKAMQAMPLVESTVYEVMRLKPAVPYQYARAKEDFILESHDAAYRIKKGELLGGVAPFVLRDPAIFKDPGTFNPRRFMGKEGKELLHYHIWSNGRQSEESSVNSKQCAAKDLVPFIGRLLLAELLIKYDSFSLADTPSGSFSALSPATS